MLVITLRKMAHVAVSLDALGRSFPKCFYFVVQSNFQLKTNFPVGETIKSMVMTGWSRQILEKIELS